MTPEEYKIYIEGHGQGFRAGVTVGAILAAAVVLFAWWLT